VLVPAVERDRQRIGERDAVLDTEIHALTAGRAVDVRCVACEQNAALPV
jgi:hypothetical protein